MYQRYLERGEEIEHLKAEARMLPGQIGAKESGGSPAAMANVERQLREQVSSLEQKITALAEENRTLRMEVRTGSGKPPAVTATKPPPEAAEPPGKLFSHRAFNLQLVSAKLTGEEVVLRFLFTNRKERILGTSLELGPARTYLVDAAGNRYRVISVSLGSKSLSGERFASIGHSFAPQMPETFSISFGKVRPSVPSGSVVLGWWLGEEGRVDAILREVRW
jgi:hypothetical protein